MSAGQQKSKLSLRAWCRMLGKDCRGVGAIEFALILPVMVLLYVGILEAGNIMTASRRADVVAYTAADLVAQVKAVSGSDVKDISEAATSIMTPFPTNGLNIILTSVVADKNNRTKVDWSCATKSGAHGKGSTMNLPAGLTEMYSSVIVAEVEYDYEPVFASSPLGFSPFTMSRTFYARPRRSASVEKTDSGGC